MCHGEMRREEKMRKARGKPEPPTLLAKTKLVAKEMEKQISKEEEN